MPRHISRTKLNERESVSLPVKFLCRICHKWKGNQQFSNKELNKFTFSTTQSNIPLTPITAKLRCRECAGGPVIELECQGPCAETKLLEKFSKAARQTGGSNWCLVCSLWKESSEHNTSVQPPPSRDSPEVEEYSLPSNLNDYEYSDPEAGDDYIDYDEEIDYTSNLTAALQLAPSRPEIIPRPYRPSEFESMKQSNKHNKHVNLDVIDRFDSSLDRPGPSRRNGTIRREDLSSVTGTEITGDDESQTSVSNRWEDISFATTASSSSQNMRPQAYNAWDPSGNRHVVNNQDLTKSEISNKPSYSTKSAWPRPCGSRNAGPAQSRYFQKKKAGDDLIDL